MISALIFDMDGLMVDTEPLHYKAFASVLHGLGITYTKEDNARYLGLSDKDESIDMVQRYGLNLLVDDLVNQKGEAYRNLIKQAKPQPGLMVLLDTLEKENFKMIIASSSSVDEIKSIAVSLHIEKYFSGFCSSELVEHGKPAPDLFLYAAERVGVQPQNCLVLEDAPKGIEAANKAGMLSYAVPSNETKGMDFSRASRVLNSLREVWNYLQQDRFMKNVP